MSSIGRGITLSLSLSLSSLFNLLLLLIVSSKFCVIDGFTWNGSGMLPFIRKDINCSSSEWRRVLWKKPYPGLAKINSFSNFVAINSQVLFGCLLPLCGFSSFNI
ncbi:unnamed protein product [Citrullus colocynthis]|uniref:Uncharacterized protein n=1 Tax=Citrullus colocynthis TaxID=252529 RepID=A0ABP0YCR3_9ROSI